MSQNLTKAVLNGKLLFPSKYISAIEFQGRDVTLTIAGIKIEELKLRGGGKETKPVLSFKGTKKQMVMNKTNASSIAEMYGPAAEKWVGCKVTFYPARTQCGRETVDCIRVRDTRPKGNEPEPQLEEPLEEEIAAEADLLAELAESEQTQEAGAQ